MSEYAFHLSDEPTELSVNSLRADLATRELSPKNHAHRSRVIRQQAEILARSTTAKVDELSEDLAERSRKAFRAPDHRVVGAIGRDGASADHEKSEHLK